MRDKTISGASQMSEPVETKLKEDAIEYFRAKSEVYAERYKVQAAGDVLWDRHEAILEMVAESKLPLGAKILDVGCGPGWLAVDLAKRGYRGVGVDAAAAMIRHCKLRAAHDRDLDLWSYSLGDVEALPFQDGSFDAAICAGVIDYLPNDTKLLREVRRVLKPNGRFILCVTNKYGYTVSLSSLLYWMKKIPGVIQAASTVRRLFIGGSRGVMEFNFQPRKHRPAAARGNMSEAGFQVERDRYVQFSLLPAPFCMLTSRLKLRIEEKLRDLDRTLLRIFGSCYILSALKKG